MEIILEGCLDFPLKIFYYWYKVPESLRDSREHSARGQLRVLPNRKILNKKEDVRDLIAHLHIYMSRHTLTSFLSTYIGK